MHHSRKPIRGPSVRWNPIPYLVTAVQHFMSRRVQESGVSILSSTQMLRLASGQTQLFSQVSIWQSCPLKWISHVLHPVDGCSIWCSLRCCGQYWLIVTLWNVTYRQVCEKRILDGAFHHFCWVGKLHLFQNTRYCWSHCLHYRSIHV